MVETTAQFLARSATPLGWFYVSAVALNAIAVLYAWRKVRSPLGVIAWLLSGGIFGGLALQAFLGHPLAMPEWAKTAIDSALGPVTFTLGTFVVLVVLLLGRQFFVRPGVAWVLFNGSLLFMGASLTDLQFAATVIRPDNLPIVAMVYLLAFFTWLGVYQAVKNDRRLAQGQPPIEKDFSDTVLVWPDVVYIELIGMILGTVILIVWALAVQAPLEQPANPALTPNPSKAPWYFVGLQEMLVYFDPSIAGVTLPLLIILGLMAVPYLDFNPQGNGYYTIRQRWFAYLVFQFGFLQLWVLLILIGTFFRGPNWSFYGLYEPQDAHKLVALTNIKLSEYFWVLWLGRNLPQVPNGAGMLSELAHILWRELPGLVLLTAYFVALPTVLGQTLLRGCRQQMGRGRYVIMTLLLLMMIMLPLKMILRWSFNLSYLVSIPEYFLNF
jgi:hypothetical protein